MSDSKYLPAARWEIKEIRMNYRQALRLAADACDESAQRIAVDANLYEHYHVESCKPRAERRAKLKAAAAILRRLAEKDNASLRGLPLFEQLTVKR